MRWLRSAVKAIDKIAHNTTSTTSIEEQIDFSDEILQENRNMSCKRNEAMHEGLQKGDSSVQMNKEGSNADVTFSVYGVDGLALLHPKRKYKRTK